MLNENRFPDTSRAQHIQLTIAKQRPNIQYTGA